MLPLMDRNVINMMHEKYKLTRPGPWKPEGLKAIGVIPEDAEFVAMVHNRFPEIVNTILALITQNEKLVAELTNKPLVSVVVPREDKEEVVIPAPKKVRKISQLNTEKL